MCNTFNKEKRKLNTRDKLVHNIYDTKYGFLHSLTLNELEGKRVSYAEIATISSIIENQIHHYGAITDLTLPLPKIFKLAIAEGSTKTYKDLPIRQCSKTIGET